jgi:hypothetical protein
MEANSKLLTRHLQNVIRSCHEMKIYINARLRRTRCLYRRLKLACVMNKYILARLIGKYKKNIHHINTMDSIIKISTEEILNIEADSYLNFPDDS